jgi:hypothetical protein
VGLIAHPDHTGTRLFGVKPYPWNDWSVEGYDGISIWDLMTDWQEKLRSLPAAVAAYLFPAAVLSGPKQATLARWDALNRRRRVAGYGEIDNHDTRKKFFGMTFRIFPYEFAFSTIRTHALLDEPLSGDAAAAKQQLLAAIRSARLYVAQERWHDARGFLVRASDGSTTAYPGDDIIPGGRPVRLEAALPTAGRIRLIKNGAMIAETFDTAAVFEIGSPGVYRVEAAQKRYGRLKPWIYANPIRVCSTEAAAEKRTAV